MGRLPASAHTDQPWRIHAIAPDFRVEDVWRFRTPGAGADDFPRMLDALDSHGPDNLNLVSRALFAIRWRLGALFGWDDPSRAVGARVPSLRDRLPADLASRPVRPDRSSPFTSVYETSEEYVSELANSTVHTLMHLGWVHDAGAEYELRMASLVKPNGVLGRAYMAGIRPIRHAIVYPSLTRTWERAWRERASARNETPPVAA